MYDKLHIIAKKAVRFNKHSGLPELIPSCEVCMSVEYSKSLDFIKYIDVHHRIKKSVGFKTLENNTNVWYLMYDSNLDKVYLKSGKTGNLPTNTLYSEYINAFDDILLNEVIPHDDIKFYLMYTIDV